MQIITVIFTLKIINQVDLQREHLKKTIDIYSDKVISNIIKFQKDQNKLDKKIHKSTYLT